ncbi:hypothetical protein LMG26788_03786 [Achromobacter pulmonis]|uniref:Transglutaminase-like domain-containing protein n=1 Tax=Achromobacter pulmonis TaxID=1389932 RepID=A0A6S7DG66_9BURK|nr:hypothetical protein [Achromobacter pulmonis]CAB3889890.1 hypothetical protein LMG26788_03720 [Achromobacter pulmonis]CAB3891225.1 hypothetical protein LMG26788_03786 [Achromobacter pulmonis]
MKKPIAILVISAALISAATAWALSRPVQAPAPNPLAGCPSVELTWLLQPVTKEERAATLHETRVPIADLETQCDQRAWLKAIATRITSPGNGETEKMMLWAGFLQDALFHSCNAPLDEQGQAVYSPIWMLWHRGVQCGQSARLFVDGMTSIGMKARLIQLHNHVSAEAWADGRWHFIETDALNDGDQIRRPDGSIPSASEIMADKGVLTGATAMEELAQYPICTNLGTITFESAFQKYKYPGDALETPYVIKKTATLEQERNHYFGWNYYEKCRLDDNGCSN